MKPIIGVSFALCVLVGTLELTPEGRGVIAAASAPFDEIIEAGFDHFDKRPVESVLIIGNSRTYYHQMPDMIRLMAASAHSPARLSITTEAWGGASFEENWNNADVQRLLAQHWDHVILQPESRAQIDDDHSCSFSTYGEKLILAARAAGSPAAVIVNWGYGEALYAGDPPGERQQYIDSTKFATQTLAYNAGAQLINTSQVWEQVHAADPSLALYEDGNHPTLYGSYLSALMIFGFMYNSKVADVSYRPLGMDDRAAQLIKSTVTKYYVGTGL